MYIWPVQVVVFYVQVITFVHICEHLHQKCSQWLCIKYKCLSMCKSCFAWLGPKRPFEGFSEMAVCQWLHSDQPDADSSLHLTRLHLHHGQKIQILIYSTPLHKFSSAELWGGCVCGILGDSLKDSQRFSSEIPMSKNFLEILEES